MTRMPTARETLMPSPLPSCTTQRAGSAVTAAAAFRKVQSRGRAFLNEEPDGFRCVVHSTALGG